MLRCDLRTAETYCTSLLKINEVLGWIKQISFFMYTSFISCIWHNPTVMNNNELLWKLPLSLNIIICCTMFPTLKGTDSSEEPADNIHSKHNMQCLNYPQSVDSQLCSHMQLCQKLLNSSNSPTHHCQPSSYLTQSTSRHLLVKFINPRICKPVYIISSSLSGRQRESTDKR